MGVASLLAAFVLFGCASGGGGGEKAAKAPASSGGGAAAKATKGGAGARKFRADDGRVIEIGSSTPANGGLRYNNPHMEKGLVWVADGFNFAGYDTLYIAPTQSTAKFNEKNAEEVAVHNLAKERLAAELADFATKRGIFARVVTKESDLKPGAKTLKIENTITEFTKGGGAARYFVGLYGGGQPVLRVRGKATDGDKSVFTYEARRSGVSADARLGGVFMKDEDIQVQDIRSLVLDLTDFMAALAGKYPAAN